MPPIPVRPLLALCATAFFCWPFDNICLADTPQQQSGGARKAADSRTAEDVALYRGRTFSQWQRSLESDLDPSFRDLALKALGTFGASGRAKEAVRAIEPYLRSKRINTARSAVNSIGQCGSEAAPILASLLKDPQYEHRDYAAISLVVNAPSAAKPYVPLIIAMTESKDNAVAIAGGRALIILGAEHEEAVAAVYETLRRFSTPKKGVVNNLPANTFIRTFDESGLSGATGDRIFIKLLRSENPFDRDLGGQLLIRYGSNDEAVRVALTNEYRRQLRSPETQRLNPSFHDLADNSFLLTCQLDAMSNLQLGSDPPTRLLLPFLHALKNMRLNYLLRKDKESPRGELDPPANPATIPFLVRLIEQIPLEERNRATLRYTVELLGDFGDESKKARSSVATLQDKLRRQPENRFPLLKKAVEKYMEQTSGATK